MPKFKTDKVPHANTLEELSKKVLKMTDEHIQSFNSNDWIELYKKIDKLLKKPREQEKAYQYKERLHNEEIEISQRQIEYLNIVKSEEETKLKILKNKRDLLPEQDRDFEKLKLQKEQAQKSLNILLNKQKAMQEAENKAKAENNAQETLVSNNKENTQTPINKDKNVPTPEAKETPSSIKDPKKTETKTPKHAETKENASKEDKEKLSQEIKELEEKIEFYNTKLSIHQNILSSEETIAKYEKDIKNKETNIKTNEDQIQSFKKAFLKKNAWNGMYLRSSYSEMFAKLYCNYRFPKDVYNYLTYMGKLIGQSLAKTNINTSEFALNIGTKRAEYGNIVSKEVLETLFPGASDYQGAIHPVSVEDIGSCYGITNNENIKLTPRIQDDLVKTIIHETIHAYGQAKSNTFSEYLYDSKIYPLSDNKDVIKSSEIANFYSVLIWNNLFYGVQGNFDEMHPTNAFQTYRGQPKERMANLVGTIAERTYRQITNQDYERNSVDLYNYTLPKIGALDSIAFDKEKKIVIHKYKATEKLTLDKVKDVFKDADELFKKELNIRQEGEFICYSVSNNWSFRSKLLNFMKKQKRKEAYQKASKEIMQQRAKQK